MLEKRLGFHMICTCDHCKIILGSIVGFTVQLSLSPASFEIIARSSVVGLSSHRVKRRSSEMRHCVSEELGVTLRSEEAGSSQTLECICHTTWCHIPENHNLNIYWPRDWNLMLLLFLTFELFTLHIMILFCHKSGMCILLSSLSHTDLKQNSFPKKVVSEHQFSPSAYFYCHVSKYKFYLGHLF
jgi:hypothetical protein